MRPSLRNSLRFSITWNPPSPTAAFFVEDRLTLADIAIASPMADLPYMEMRVDAGRYPRLATYLDSILSRPSFAVWVERETALLARIAA